MAKKRRVVEVNLPLLDGLVDATEQRYLSPEERLTLKTALHEMAQGLMPSLNSEKFEKLLERHRPRPSTDEETEQKKVPGHGRNGAAAFTGAARVPVPHASLRPGGSCEHCPKGKVYLARSGPAPLIRVTGQVPFQATVYELERLRCNLCGEYYQADVPEGVGPDKYDETVASMIGILKYGKGVPFNRLEGLQKSAGVPLPASTQWEIVEEAAELLKPVYEELVHQAAQADLEYVDDTRARILEVQREPDDERTGVFTTAMVAELNDGKIALFMSGTQHAGENSTDVLAHREPNRSPVIFMSDALNHNKPDVNDGVELVVANCLAHGRRQFVESLNGFPDQCLHVLEQLGTVYKNDAQARELGLDPNQRLKYHQAHSKSVMSELHKWLEAELEEKRVEPNSRLGKAMKYLLTHWKELTLFLRHPGAPLDNNICERAIKKAVLHRKNALFYRNLDGAFVGDVFMSLIHSCELNGVNPFNYLNALQRHALAARARPSAWMPWNYEASAGNSTA